MRRRIPVIALALAGFGVSLYLALCQVTGREPWTALSLIQTLVPGLGYLCVAVAGVPGNSRCWHTAPGIVLLNAIAVGPVTAIAHLFILSQPLLTMTNASFYLVSLSSVVRQRRKSLPTLGYLTRHPSSLSCSPSHVRD